MLRLLSDPHWGGSTAGQEGVKESFKDKKALINLEFCNSGSGFGQIFQGVDPGRAKKERKGFFFDEILLQTKNSQQHTDALPTTLSTHLFDLGRYREGH